MPPERYLAPLGVLGLHVLLLANVVGHRTHLLHFGSLEIAEWIVVVVAILAYLRTVCALPDIVERHEVFEKILKQHHQNSPIRKDVSVRKWLFKHHPSCEKRSNPRFMGVFFLTVATFRLFLPVR